MMTVYPMNCLQLNLEKGLLPKMHPCSWKGKTYFIFFLSKRYFSQNTLKPKEDKKEEKPATEENPKAEKNEEDVDGIDDSKLKTLKKSQKVAEIGGKTDKNKKPKKKSKMKGVKNKALLSFDE